MRDETALIRGVLNALPVSLVLWAIIIFTALALAGCQSAPVNSPCGVIKDSLLGVNATTSDGQRRLNVHHERGASAGCWK